MIGAIAGDIIGSTYEMITIKTKDFPLFNKWSRFTDDTVMTIAVASCLLNKTDYTATLQKFGRKYPKKKYGTEFLHWIFNEKPNPYNSFGNGSAMRVSSIGFYFNNLDKVLQEAQKCAEISHNHPEGIKGAQSVAAAIFLAKVGKSKIEIKDYIENKFGYNLSLSLDEIRPNYSFNTTCQGSVPESIISFLESTDYEDCIRNAISLGGDSDTMACIAGGIAQAFYKKIPERIITEIRNRLKPDLLSVVDHFNLKINCIF